MCDLKTIILVSVILLNLNVDYFIFVCKEHSLLVFYNLMIKNHE